MHLPDWTWDWPNFHRFWGGTCRRAQFVLSFFLYCFCIRWKDSHSMSITSVRTLQPFHFLSMWGKCLVKRDCQMSPASKFESTLHRSWGSFSVGLFSFILTSCSPPSWRGGNVDLRRYNFFPFFGWRRMVANPLVGGVQQEDWFSEIVKPLWKISLRWRWQFQKKWQKISMTFRIEWIHFCAHRCMLCEGTPYANVLNARTMLRLNRYSVKIQARSHEFFLSKGLLGSTGLKIMQIFFPCCWTFLHSPTNLNLVSSSNFQESRESPNFGRRLWI